MTVTYIAGDATDPQVDGDKIILHSCNNIGAWGSGFVMALSRKWPEPELMYRHWAESFSISKGNTLPLGCVQLVQVEKDIYVANMIGQHGLISANNRRPASPTAFRIGMFELAEILGQGQFENPSIHMPRIGCGLGGLTWDEVEPIIELLPMGGYPAYVYDLE